MMRAMPGIAGLALALASCASLDPSTRLSSTYVCRVEQADANGTVLLSAAVLPDGTRDGQHGWWESPSRRGAVSLRIERSTQSTPTLLDLSTVTVSFRRSWMPRRRLRLELSHEGERARNGVLANPFFSQGRNPIALTLPQREFLAFAAGARSVVAVVAEERGSERARDHLDLALFEIADQAFADAQLRLEAMMADFGNLCERDRETIIVT
jgi:hypothetical protein